MTGLYAIEADRRYTGEMRPAIVVAAEEVGKDELESDASSAYAVIARPPSAEQLLGGPRSGVTGNTTMNILIVDDHPVMRAGISACLRELDGTIDVVEAEDLRQAVDAARAKTSFDVVLFDLALPGVSGVEAVIAFREAVDPSPPIVVFSGTDDPETVTAALDAGAMGFIPKTSTPAILQNALRIVLANGVYVPPTILGRSASLQPSQERPGGQPLRSLSELGLTPRQQQVCALMVRGQSVKHIARDLGISPATVKAHLQPILRTLGVMNRTEAIVALHRLRFSLETDPTDGA